MLKSVIHYVISQSVRSDRLWRLFDAAVVRPVQYVQRERARLQRPVVDEDRALTLIAPDMVVRHGVFQGMRYPHRQSVGSRLVPKLLGSYEREIHPLIERLCAVPYTDVVDVGCAEGYYAVGLALRLPSARVVAFDVDPQARELCSSMAAINGVADRVTVREICDEATLCSLQFRGRALIVADCEGYERELFTPRSVTALARHDVLVEVHDFVDIGISGYLRDVFAATHTVEEFQSLDDIHKAQQYEYEELESFDLASRRVLLGEYRPAIMSWFYMRPRDAALP
jgi:hypothetical protein